MVSAYVLVQTEVGRSRLVAEALAKLSHVTQADDVTGPYDVIAVVTAANADALSSVVLPAVQAVPGITRTLTCPLVTDSVIA